MDAATLESHLIPKSQWVSAPQDACRLALDETDLGVPTGIAQDPETGKWFVIQSSGQGPYIIWEQELL